MTLVKLKGCVKWESIAKHIVGPAAPLNPRGRIPERMTEPEAKLADKAPSGAERGGDED